jgi:hypothetical protein
MGSINIDNAQGQVAQVKSGNAEVRRDPLGGATDIDESESGHHGHARSLHEAYQSAVIEITEAEWLNVDELESSSEHHEKDRRRKRERAAGSETGMPIPASLPPELSIEAGPVIEPAQGAQEAVDVGARESGDSECDDVPPHQAAERVAKRGDAPSQPIDATVTPPARTTEGPADTKSEAGSAHGGVQPVDSPRRLAARSVVKEADTADASTGSVRDETPADVIDEADDALDVRGRRKAERSTAHTADPVQFHSIDAPSVTPETHVPNRHERRHEASSPSVVQQVEVAPIGTGTVVNYRFKSWHGQPTIRAHLAVQNGASNLSVSTADRRAESAMRQHASSLKLDVPLQFVSDLPEQQEGDSASADQRQDREDS